MRFHVPGQTTNTKLYLSFADGSTADGADNSLTVTPTATAPEWAAGIDADALQFGTGSDTRRLDVTGSGLALAGPLTIEFACLPESTSTTQSVIARRATAGGEKDAYVVTVGATAVTFTVYDGVGGSNTVTNAVPLPWTHANMTASRWRSVRCVFDSAAALLWLFVDGALVGKATASTVTALPTTNLGALQIGGEASTTATSQFVGRLAYVTIRAEIDTDPKTMACRLGPQRVTRRHLSCADIDWPEFVEGESWTTPTGYYWYIAASVMDIGALIIDREDIVSVKATTSAGVTTTFAEYGNIPDLQSNADKWHWDAANRRFYSSMNPTTYASFAVTVRVRMANVRVRRGDRWYIPAIASVDAGERRFNYWEQAWQSGAGGKVTIAKHASLPADLGNEEASDIVWSSATATIRTLSDGMPWSASVVDFGGFIDAQPDDSPESWTATIYHEAARVHRVPLGDRVADVATFPYMHQGHSGHVWPIIAGKGHQRVKAICVDARNNAGRHKWKVIADPPTGQKGLTYMAAGVGPSRLSFPAMYTVDLRVGEFYLSLATAAKDADVWCDVEGWGTSTNPTTAGPVGAWGNASECLTSGSDIGQEMLRYAGVETSAFGSSWAATFGRALARWRVADQLADANSLGGMLVRFQSDLLASIYYVPSTGKWECEDVVKADASQWTIRDEDILSLRWIPDRSLVAKRANVVATDYVQTTSGIRKGIATTLALTGLHRSGIREVFAPERMSGHASVGALDLWLPKVRAHLENTTYFADAVLTSAYRTIEQFDVVTVTVDTLPSGAGSRFRVLSVRPAADGTVAVSLFPETHWPSDGSSISETRTGGSPFYVTQRIPGAGAGGTLIDAKGAWTTIGLGIFDVVTGVSYATDKTDRFNVVAQRVGGASDADLKFRLTADATLATTTALTTTAGTSTTLAVQTATTFTRPTARRLIRHQYYLDAGATEGRIGALGWQAEEGSTNAYETWMLPSTLWESSYHPGAVCPARSTSTWTIVPFLRGGIVTFDRFFPGSIVQWVIYASGATGTGFQLQVRRSFVWQWLPTITDVNLYLSDYIADFGTITTEGFYVSTGMRSRSNIADTFRLSYKCTSGYGTVWVAGLYVHQNYSS